MVAEFCQVLQCPPRVLRACLSAEGTAVFSKSATGAGLLPEPLSSELRRAGGKRKAAATLGRGDG